MRSPESHYSICERLYCSSANVPFSCELSLRHDLDLKKVYVHVFGLPALHLVQAGHLSVAWPHYRTNRITTIY